MTGSPPGPTNGHFHLVRVSTLGFILEVLWVLIGGPVWLSRWERTTSWMSLVLAAALLVLWRTRPVQRFLAAQASDPTCPARIFVANIGFLLVVAVFLFGQIRYNPDALASWRNARDLAFLGGAFLLALLSFCTNLIARRLDRRG